MRRLALALLGLGSVPAFAQGGGNVMAFNPYSGVGLPGGPTATFGAQAAYPIVDTVGPAYASGPAFNPWQPIGPAPVASPVVGAFNPSEPPVTGAGPAPTYVYNPAAYLPSPPRDATVSRIVAIPERGDARIPRDLLSGAPARQEVIVPATPPPAPAPPPPAPMPAPAKAEPPPPPAPPPTPIARPTPPPAAVAAATPATIPAAPPAPAAPAAAPAPVNRGIAVTTSSLEPTAKGSALATIPFAGQSADLSDAAKAELDRIAKNIADRSLRQIELRAFASGAEPDNRKIALARALVVRSYLIDRGVKSRIEVGAFAGDGERVDILAPNT